MTTKMLRPGLLVSLSARVSGGVVYDRKDLDAREVETTIPGVKAEITKWETTKIIDDPDEFERATKLRSKARNLIASVCAKSEFGLLCPSAKEFDLNRAIDEAKRIAAEHNATAKRSFIGVYVIQGRVSQDDAEAVRAISSEVGKLLRDMEEGIKKADPEAIRTAANAAKSVGMMLSDEAGAKVQGAIESARKAARDIVRRVQKSGEEASKVIAECDLKALSEARGVFLDLDANKTVDAQPVEAAPLDLAPATTTTATAPTAAEIEF